MLKLLLVLCVVLVVSCAATVKKDAKNDEKKAADPEMVTLYDAKGNSFQVLKKHAGPKTADAPEMTDDEFEKIFDKKYKIGGAGKKAGGIAYNKDDFEGDDNKDVLQKESLVVTFKDNSEKTIEFNGDFSKIKEQLKKEIKEIFWVKNGQVKEFSKDDAKAGVEAWIKAGHPVDKVKKSTEKKETRSNIPEAESKVVELNDSNILDKTKKGTWVVMMYADWCDYCKKLKPTWNRLANVVPNVARANADSNDNIMKFFGISKFPTLMKISNGKYLEYTGKNTLEDLIAWSKKTEILTSEVNLIDGDTTQVTGENIWELVEGINSMIYLYSEKWAEKNKDTFLAARKKLGALAEEIFKADKADYEAKKQKPDSEHWMISKMNIDGQDKVLKILEKGVTSTNMPCIVVLQNEKFYVLKASTSLKDLRLFTKAKRDAKDGFMLAKPVADLSKLVTLTDKNFEQKIKNGRWVVMFHAPWCGYCKKFMPKFGKAAADMADNKDIHFGIIDGTEGGKEMNARFKVTGFPTLFLIENGKMLEMPPSVQDAKATIEFAKDESNKLKSGKNLPSAPKPFPKGKAKDIIKLTPKNIAAKIKKGKWFIKVYADWCGHCKTLAPKWASLATYAKKNKMDVNIAQYDADQKPELPASIFKIEGLPTILIIDPSAPKKIKEYMGQHQPASMVAFLNGEDDSEEEQEQDNQKHEGKEHEDEHAKPTPKIPTPTTQTDINLTGKNFWSKIGDGNVWLVKVYAPWCGGCQEMAQDWENLAIKLKEDKEYKVANINGDKYEALIDSLGVEGFPTIYKVKGGKNYIEYEGDRTVAAMEEFLKNDSHEAGEWKNWTNKKATSKKDDL